MTKSQASINICELSDIFQGMAVNEHPFKGRGVSDMVKLGYRFGCLVTYLPDMQKDRDFIAQMRGILSEMLDIADENMGAKSKIILPLAKDNPVTEFVRNIVLKHFAAKGRFEFMGGEYVIKHQDIRGDKQNVLRSGVRGIIPARKTFA